MPSVDTSREFDIRTYGAVLLRRKWIIVATLILVVAGAYFMENSKTRLYAASGEMLFTQRSTAAAVDSISNATPTNDPQRKLATDVRLIQSSEVRKVAQTFYRDAVGIRAIAATDADIITLIAVSDDPQKTDRTVTAYLRAFVEYRRTSTLDDVLAAQQVLTKRIDRLNVQIADLDKVIPKATEPARSNLLNQRANFGGQQDLARQQIERLQESVTFEETPRILARPSTPTEPYTPTPRRAATQAAAVGLVLGIGLAFLRDILDDSIKSKDDLEMAAPNVSVLGLIPTITPKLAPNELVAVTRPDSAAAEAYRSLRTSIQFMSLERPVRTLQITSPSASEGKTTTAANLAVTLASIGKRVVVVCCDLRRPRIHELFGVSNDVGFTSVLLGEVSLADALQPVKGVNGLLVLASGKPPPNPAELLAGARATELFKALADNADIVVVDSPPVLPVTDAAVIANRVDATILVASASSSVRKRFSHALQILGQVDSHVIGAVLNDAPRGAAGYGYGYGYGDEERYIADPDAKSPTNGKASPSPKPRRKQQAGKRRR